MLNVADNFIKDSSLCRNDIGIITLCPDKMKGMQTKMSECICNNCKNLKGVMDDSGAVEEYECEFGFPSEKCVECDEAGCDLACAHFIIDEDEDKLVSVKCSSCGRELSQAGNDNTDGKIYCINCFLSHK